MTGGEPGGDDSIYKFRGELTERVNSDGQPDPNGEPRGMSADARKYGHEPLKSAQQIEDEAIAAERAVEQARDEIAAT